jgi:glutaredoxin
MLERIRDRLHRGLTSDAGDFLPLVRIARRLLCALHDWAGRPLLPRPAAPPQAVPPQAAPRPEPAPIMIYVEWDSPGVREMEALLAARGLSSRVLPIDGDEATRSWLSTQGLAPPALFIAGDPVGDLPALRRLAESGELERRVLGAARAAHSPETPLGDPAQAAQVYGRATDPWTMRAASLLERRGLRCQQYDLDAPEHVALSDRLVRETRRNRAPYVFLRGRFIGGYRELDELDRLGQLDALLHGGDAERPGRPRIVVEITPREREEVPGER